MRPVLAILWIALAFAAAEAIADDRHRTPISVLVDAAKKALKAGDEKTFDNLDKQLFERTTGFPYSPNRLPVGITRAEYEARLCPYRKVKALVLTTERIRYLHHGARLSAYFIVEKREENAPYVRAILECSQDNGDLVPDAKALRKGIAWAEKLKSADIGDARTMALEYEALSERFPDDPIYGALAGLVRAQVSTLRSKLEPQNRPTEDGYFQGALVDKAHKGDLSAQMEVARRLETGKRFRQNNAMSYYWYKRSLENGGGEAARSGMNRLHPQLSAGELLSIEVWTKNKLRPY